MQDMSDLRKSIAERLGSAAKSARPGAKAKMAKYRAFVYRGSPRSNVLVKATEWMDSAIAAEEAAKQIAMSFRGQPGYNSDNYFADIAQETPMGAKTVKNNVRFSRPGAKAKMAADPALASFLKKWKRNEADNYHSENVVMLAKFVGTSGDVAEANRIMQQHDEMGYLTPELNSKRYALYTALKAKLLAKYPGVTFSRPGAKAKFAEDAREVAQEILRQLGGGRFMAMVGGKNAFHGTFGGKPGLQIDIGKGAEGGINRLIVKLDRGSDTYDMEFWRVAKRGMDVKKVSEASGVYADDLQRIFTSRTKFYTSLSRPGAKAKMGREYSGNSKRLNNGTVVAAWDNGDAAQFANATQAQSFSDKHGLGGVYQSPSSRTFFVLVAKATASRPGAKAKMAKWESTLTKKDGKPMEEFTATIHGEQFMIEVKEQAGKPIATLYIFYESRGFRPMGQGTLQAMMNKAQRYAEQEAKDVDAIGRSVGFWSSRPGVKAKMRQTLQAMHDGLQWKVVIPSGAAWYSDDGKQWTKKHGEPVPSSEVKQYEIKLGTGFARPGAKGSSKAKA
jgi:hypothetical protein